MKIEAVIVCENYADFLAATLPWNLPHFDHVCVITGFDDAETIELCRKYSVTCIPTDVMRLDGEDFNKGRAIDLGIGMCNGADWICHLDADTWLPPMTRRHIEEAHIDPECIYGIDRVLCPSYEAWEKFIGGTVPPHQHDYHARVHVPPFPLADRISLRAHSGFVPIGFFQLFSAKHHRRYPLRQGDAERSDVNFSLQWPSKNRRLLAEIIGVHLESEPSPLGRNWKGRKTKRFGPAPSIHHGGQKVPS